MRQTWCCPREWLWGQTELSTSPIQETAWFGRSLLESRRERSRLLPGPLAAPSRKSEREVGDDHRVRHQNPNLEDRRSAKHLVHFDRNQSRGGNQGEVL